jgi:hypothetical protein
MFIQTEATPNPATLKFIPGKPVLPGSTREYRAAEEAADSPLAQRLFSVQNVSGIFLGHDFITVSKSGGEWQHLKPAILGLIMDHYLSGTPVVLKQDEGQAVGAGIFDAADGQIVRPSGIAGNTGQAGGGQDGAATSPSRVSRKVWSIST